MLAPVAIFLRAVGMASTARWGLKFSIIQAVMRRGEGRNGLYSPLGIEMSLRLTTGKEWSEVGMASTARWGLKFKLWSCLLNAWLKVGMASTARWGLKCSIPCGILLAKPCRNGLYSPLGIEIVLLTTVALVEVEEELSPPASPKRRPLLQVSLQRGRRLLQHGDGQAVGRSQVQIVGVIADLPMRAPGCPG